MKFQDILFHCIALLALGNVALAINVVDISLDSQWPPYLPSLAQQNSILPLVKEYVFDSRVSLTNFGDCDKLGKKGVEYKNLRCFFNIIRRCMESEAKCEYNLKHQSAGARDGSLPSAILEG